MNTRNNENRSGSALSTAPVQPAAAFLTIFRLDSPRTRRRCVATAALVFAMLSSARAAPPAADAGPPTNDIEVARALKTQIETADPVLGARNPAWDETKTLVRGLSLGHMTPDAMKLVGKLRGLQQLLVSNSGLSADDFAPIAMLPELCEVDIVHVPVDSAIFRRLESLPSLDSLSLSETRITSLAGLERLKRLHALTIETSTLRAGQLAPLAKLTELEWLDITEVGIVDCDLVHLQKLKKLVSLTLVDTKITNCGLRHLACLTELDVLRLRAPHVTDQGSDWLQKKLPHTNVMRFDNIIRPGHNP
jgi:hypothetical protein